MTRLAEGNGMRFSGMSSKNSAGLIGLGLAATRRRFDGLNRSLAAWALPEDRREAVGKLALERKACAAGHRVEKNI